METYFGKTFDEVFESSFKEFTKGMEMHQFIHFNKSLGMRIYSKEHLKVEMKKRRMLPFDVCEGLAEDWDKRRDNYENDKCNPSEKAVNIIKSLKMMADKNGNLKLGGRAIEALKEIGAIKGIPEYMGDIREYSTVGGFN